VGRTRRLTFLNLLYPFLSLLEAEGSFGSAIIAIWVNVEDLIVRA
jgi:hypothetical protein